MGVSASRKTVIRLKAIEDADINVDDLIQYSYGVADPFEVQHYMPPHFPILPRLSSQAIHVCRETWTLIHTAATPIMKSHGRPGVALFYDEFFYRIHQRDTTLGGVFPNAMKRGEVLIRAIQFILALKADTKEEVHSMTNRCRFLGHRHRSFPKVRPHHFATYSITMVEVIMYWLGDSASTQVGMAWSNTVGFVLQHILEPLLYKRIDPYQSYQNTMISAVREITNTRLEIGDTKSYSTKSGYDTSTHRSKVSVRTGKSSSSS